MLAAHQLENLDDWLLLTCAFVSFGLCASAVYVANDLLDLESDRIHPRKRNRPFAAGVLPVWKGVVASPVLAVLGMALAALVGKAFVAWLAVYLALTTLYSCVLKRMLLIDCFVLALLYTVRVLAGGSVVGLQISFWLLAFSVFLFLSLAFVKRYAEMELQRAKGRSELHGRGYRTGDAGLVQNMGIAAGQASVLVLALYLNSDAVARLYRSPTVIWAAVPVMLFWIHWMWMQAHRGNMHDDPVVFAVRDRTSQVAGVLVGLILLAGALGWP
jgi:4-hydroxybenzoate polyprenyltransferase